MSRLSALFAGVTVTALIGASAYFALAPRSDDRFAQCRATAIAGGTAAIGGPFELVDATGAIRNEADVITKPSLIYFGYTFCPDVCPLDVARNAEAADMLVAEGHDVQPVFISIDPGRDTPDVVGDFAANMHPGMIGLTGTPQQVKAASTAYRTYYRAHETGDEFYLVDHSTFSYLALPGDGVVEVFRRDLPPAELAEQIACFVDAA